MKTLFGLIKIRVLFPFLLLFLSGCGCREYASNYSCSYIKNKATYDVYFWNNINLGDGEKIGTVTGLASCRELAQNVAFERSQMFGDRKYVCFLMEDGAKIERHRPLD